MSVILSHPVYIAAISSTHLKQIIIIYDGKQASFLVLPGRYLDSTVIGPDQDVDIIGDKRSSDDQIFLWCEGNNIET